LCRIALELYSVPIFIHKRMLIPDPKTPERSRCKPSPRHKTAPPRRTPVNRARCGWYFPITRLYGQVRRLQRGNRSCGCAARSLHASNQCGGKKVCLLQPHRKLSTSIRSLPFWSVREYRIHRPSGETDGPDTGFSIVAIGLVLFVAKVKNWME
jgi:hypothetical protein